MIRNEPQVYVCSMVARRGHAKRRCMVWGASWQEVLAIRLFTGSISRSLNRASREHIGDLQVSAGRAWWAGRSARTHCSSQISGRTKEAIKLGLRHLEPSM